MARAYYSTVFEQPAQDIWKIIRDFNNYTVWVAEPAKAGSRMGNPATPSAPYGMCSTRDGIFGSGSWPNPMSSGPRLTNFARRQRCR